MKPSRHLRYVLIALIALTTPSQTTHARSSRHTIKSVAPIAVTTPEGHVPSLPWRVWVTYKDGSHEWRQTRWDNALRAIEEQQASAQLYPAGKEYDLAGYVIGDNTTDDGYPISAHVTVTTPQHAATQRPTLVAEPLPLGDVVITGHNRLTSNRDLDLRAILSWDVRQQLYNYRDTYGLPTEGYPEADGWDSPTTKLKGHGSGHYMSALAFAYASLKGQLAQAPDATLQAQADTLLSRIRLMVNELRACQERTFVWNDSLGRYWEARDLAPEEELRTMQGTWEAFDRYKQDYRHYGYGYLNAIPAQHPVLIEMYRAYNNEDWVWAPYYSIHKQLAGLIDIALNVDDQDIRDKALLTATDMGLWVWNRLHYRTYVQTEGDRSQRQARPGNRYEMWNMYIAGEVGGMEESLARLAEMNDDAERRSHLLEAASFFDAPAFFEPLSRNIDDIRTRHANQHIPMITGALRAYRVSSQPTYYDIALNFWNLTQGRYVYAMGGVGNGEMFRQPYSQILSMNTNVEGWGGHTHLNPTLNETCCAYNMAKLTKDLNCFQPNDARYMDYYERVLYNQLVGSVHPTEYATTYQYAVGLNARKPFGNETPQSTCCGGTGAENHVKYQEAAYFAGADTLWVALYLPSIARWRDHDITLTQTCAWPADASHITIGGSGTFTLKLRIPYWAHGATLSINGKKQKMTLTPCSYATLTRTWNDGDAIDIRLPFDKHINWGPDKMEIAAGEHFEPEWVGTLMYGPLVMASPTIHQWDEAQYTLQSDLSDITLHQPTTDEGTDGHLYTLTLGDHLFQPDYYQTERATHYLRLHVEGPRQAADGNRQGGAKRLQQLLDLAHERIEAQAAWDRLSVKVPEFSPWAPYGFARLQSEVAQADSLMALPSSKRDKAEVDARASALNAAINTMRPGNLAEPEDLHELLPLLTSSKEIRGKNTQLREAIDYADMVVQYVNDGSGTHDLIRKALTRLRTALDSLHTTQPSR